MIEYVRGTLADLAPTEAVVEACGVGYKFFISLNTFSAIQGKAEVRLYAYEAIREDAHLLFGFATKQERELFLLLIGISGVGGQTARTILSAFTPSELANIISTENASLLKGVKGIGPKAAQRIIVELKDKMPLAFESPTDSKDAPAAGKAASRQTVEEAVAALAMLGFPPAPTQKTVLHIVESDPSLTVEQVVKQALKMM